MHVQPLPNSVHVGQLPSNCSTDKSFIRERNRRGLGLGSFLSLVSFSFELRVLPANVIVGPVTPPFGLNLIVGALTSFDYPGSTRGPKPRRPSNILGKTGRTINHLIKPKRVCGGSWQCLQFEKRIQPPKMWWSDSRNSRTRISRLSISLANARLPLKESVSCKRCAPS